MFTSKKNCNMDITRCDRECNTRLIVTNISKKNCNIDITRCDRERNTRLIVTNITLGTAGTHNKAYWGNKSDEKL